MKLTELIPETYSYLFEKLGDGFFDRDKLPFAKAALNSLVGITKKVNAEVESRFKGGMNAMSGLSILLTDMEYEASRISGWIEGNQLFQNKDAKVFIHAYATDFEKFIEIVGEVDIILEK